MNKTIKHSIRIAVLSTVVLSGLANSETSVSYIGNGLINVSRYQSMNGSVYGDGPHLIPSLYFGGVQNGKIVTPNIDNIRGTPNEDWFVANQNPQNVFFGMNKTNKNSESLRAINDRWATPFQRDDAKNAWFNAIKSDFINIEKADSFLIKVDAVVSDYDVNKGAFFLNIKGGPLSCISTKPQTNFKEESLNKRLGKYQFHTICIDLKNITKNRNPFRELKTPKDIARSIYDNGAFYYKNRVLVECNIKDLKMNGTSNVKTSNSKMYGNVITNNFATCEAKKLHIMNTGRQNADPVYSLLSYELVNNNPVQEVKEVKPVKTNSKVGDFKDNSKAKTFKKETQVIDITE